MYHEITMLIRLVVIFACVVAGYFAILTGNRLFRLIVTVVYGCALIYYVFASRLITAAIYFNQHVAHLASGPEVLEDPIFWKWGINKVFASSSYGGRYGFMMNVMLFIPLGYILPSWTKWLHSIMITTFIGFCLSFFIEHFQRWTGLGVYDVKDMIANTTGCFLGAVAIMPTLWMKDHKARVKRQAQLKAEAEARGEAEAARLDRISRQLANPELTTRTEKIKLSRKAYRELQNSTPNDLPETRQDDQKKDD
ncbi:VanZ family protein [Lactobacillus sp.]|uniref:VanZ family protein n=1 Tax=Lactobacillus sp. TaxID=1591 RepID=UPI003EF5C8CF